MHNFLLYSSTKSVHVASADFQCLGRCDTASLSQQSLMELLVENIPCEKKLKENSGDFKDIAYWPGVACGSGDTVTSIRMYRFFSAGGTIQPEFFPPTVHHIDIRENKLHGSIDLTRLPVGLRSFQASKNLLAGSADLTNLPKEMQVLKLDNNQIGGTIDLTQLPVRIRQVDLSKNCITGEVNLSKLPEQLTELFLHHNDLTGSITLRFIPSELYFLDLSHNSLSGTLDAELMPHRMLMLNLNDNAFDLSDGCTESFLNDPATQIW